MKEVDTDIVVALNHSMEMELPEKISFEDLREKLSKQINLLIENDFHKLISILYRIDVSESKLKKLLSENPGTDSGEIIANLIIERQIQKIKSRRQFNKRDKNTDDDENW